MKTETQVMEEQAVPQTIIAATTPFFRASCGCVGFWWGCRGDWGNAKMVPLWSIVRPCDADTSHLSISQGMRTFDADKTYVELTTDESKAIVEHLAELIECGYRWLEFARSVKTTPELSRPVIATRVKGDHETSC